MLASTSGRRLLTIIDYDIICRHEKQRASRMLAVEHISQVPISPWDYHYTASEAAG